LEQSVQEICGDYREFCEASDFKPDLDDGAAFLRNYVYWASDLVTAAPSDFMPCFVGWVRRELPPDKSAALDTEFASTLYATAFEFVAIGASPGHANWAACSRTCSARPVHRLHQLTQAGQHPGMNKVFAPDRIEAVRMVYPGDFFNGRIDLWESSAEQQTVPE